MIIYKTTCLINNKIYIGLDTKNDCSYLGSGLLLKKAIKKYGKENFIKEILEFCNDINLLNEREIYWISFFDSTNLEKGYNLSKGGKGVLGIKQSNETCKKISESHKGNKNYFFGKKHSSETLKKIGNANKGRKRSQEVREKMSKSKLGSKLTEETKNKIRESNKGEKHRLYGKRISEKTRLKMSISHKINGDRPPSWSGKQHSEETKKKLSASHKGSNSYRARKVIDNKTGRVWDCAKEVALFFKINYSTLICKLNGKSNNNTSFVYLEDK